MFSSTSLKAHDTKFIFNLALNYFEVFSNFIPSGSKLKNVTPA